MRILLVLLFLFPAFVGGQNLDIKSSEVKFSIKNAGLTVNGSFGNVSGSISFDPEKYIKGKIDVSLEAKTINTGISSRDNHLRKEEYFNVEKFPKISITSRFFGKSETGYTAYLSLSMKGKSGFVTMPFTYTKSGTKIIIEGSFTLDRLDYGIGESSFVMGDKVTVKIKLTCEESSKTKKSTSPKKERFQKALNAEALKVETL